MFLEKLIDKNMTEQNNKQTIVLTWFLGCIVIIFQWFTACLLLFEYLWYEDKFVVRVTNIESWIANAFLKNLAIKLELFVNMLNTFPQTLLLCMSIFFFMSGLLHFIMVYYKIKITLLYAIIKSSFMGASISILSFYFVYLNKVMIAGNDILVSLRYIKIYYKVAYGIKMQMINNVFTTTIGKYPLMNGSQIEKLKMQYLKIINTDFTKDFLDTLSTGEIVSKAQAHVDKLIQDMLSKIALANSTNGSWLPWILGGVLVVTVCGLVYFVLVQNGAIDSLYKSNIELTKEVENVTKLVGSNIDTVKAFVSESATLGTDTILSEVSNTSVIVDSIAKLIVNNREQIGELINIRVQLNFVLNRLNQLPIPAPDPHVDLGELP